MILLTVVKSVSRNDFPSEGVVSEAPVQYAWTWEAYLDWEAKQPLRYELVDGQVYTVVGGTSDHDTIGNNLRSELWTALRGTKCRVQGPELKIRAGGNVRYPDALIDCGPTGVN